MKKIKDHTKCLLLFTTISALFLAGCGPSWVDEQATMIQRAQEASEQNYSNCLTGTNIEWTCSQLAASYDISLEKCMLPENRQLACDAKRQADNQTILTARVQLVNRIQAQQAAWQQASQYSHVQPTYQQPAYQFGTAPTYGTPQTGGKFLGTLNANQYDPNSVSNPYGQYGSRYSPTSINNPYSKYGSPYSPDSANNPYTVGGPKLMDPENGKFLGNLNSNRYDPDSVSNPYGRYGNPYSPDSINNPYGTYGNPYSPTSATNPFATSGPAIIGDDQ